MVWWMKFTRDPDTGCLRWTGQTDQAGYGRSKGTGRAAGEIYVHRIVYVLVVGPIPAGLELDHVHERGCRYQDCAEPAHLEPVTHAENQRRAGRAKTHCKWGHDRQGKRQCPTCNRERQRRYLDRIRAGEVRPCPSYLASGYRDRTVA